MESTNLQAQARKRYDDLMNYYLENNDQSYCARLTYTYVIMGMIVRTFDEISTTHIVDFDAYYKFIGLVTLFTEKLDSCGPQTPEPSCLDARVCTGMWCTSAYDLYSPNKLISLLERFRAEMFGLDHGVNGTFEKVHALSERLKA